MRYLLSKIIPVPMRTRYGLVEADGSTSRWTASWVQFRGRIFRHRVTAVA